VSYLNPMVYIVSGVRFGLLGQSAVPPLTAMGVLAAAAAVSVLAVVGLFRRGYGLTE
jgi:ABC-2 type transport system permease protein